MGKIIGEGITFDDVLLVPAYSEVIPNQVDLTTYLLEMIFSEPCLFDDLPDTFLCALVTSTSAGMDSQ